MTDTDSKVDPLLQCLVFFTAHYKRARSAQALIAGLAYGDSDMGPTLFCEAADRIDLKSKVVQRKTIE